MRETVILQKKKNFEEFFIKEIVNNKKKINRIILAISLFYLFKVIELGKQLNSRPSLVRQLSFRDRLVVVWATRGDVTTSTSSSTIFRQ